MIAHFSGWDQRTLELALDEVTFGLDPLDREELLARVDPRALEELEFAVASLNVAALGKLESPPAELTRRIAAAGRARLATTASTPPASQRPAPIPSARPRGWVAAALLAAALVLAVFVLDRVRERRLAPFERREQLLASASDLVRAAWKASDDPFAGGVSGDVVWSSARQEGYMTLRSLPANDPARNQYQLWIFDSTRAEWEAKPVDGGVFDVAPGAEVIVPIDAKLEVRRAAMFALTLEAPGGVVVSAREHLLAIATP